MKLVWGYVKSQKRVIFTCIFFAIIFVISFVLYELPMKAVWYPIALCFGFGIIFLAIDFFRVKKKHETLEYIKKLQTELIDNIPSADTVEEADYKELIEIIIDKNHEAIDEENLKYKDMMDYYTVWAHQIKTPIAAMRLQLQNNDSPSPRVLQNDLDRIERYVEMVLTYLKLDSSASDYVIEEYELDDIVRGCVKKFSREFIERKLSLNYEPLNFKVLTDEKWLSFAIEQILSNALKYTNEGSISIYMEEGSILCIEDTGIGILADNLPRIFENGYTGFNGRTDKRASGIGLYLTRRTLNNLGHSVWARSTPGVGTTICVDLKRSDLTVE